MEFAVINRAIATIYEDAAITKHTQGQELSAIADEGLYGMLVRVTGSVIDGFVPVQTFYGYSGYALAGDLLFMGEEGAGNWEHSGLFVTDGICADVLSLPKVQGVCLASLYRGSLVAVREWDYEDTGWAQVRLADGQTGYMRNQFLSEKKFSQEGVFTGRPVQKRIVSEEQFRRDVTGTAKKYLGVQYRWGGRSTAGIDCSGLTSASYMQNGILTWRDAKIVEGFPVHEIEQEKMKPGDLLYFPGHIAMYLGNGEYIHSTGKRGSGGVVINSLDPSSPVFREDLVKSLYAAGSIF